MGQEGPLGKAEALAEHHARDQGGDPGADVDDGAPGEVQGGQLEEPAVVRPDPVGEGVVHEGGPQEGEQHVGREPHALRDGAADEGGSDHREHALEDREGEVRDRLARERLLTHGPEEEEVETAHQSAGAESQAVTEDHPLHADQASQEEAVHERRQHVALADQPSVEQRQSRRRHEQDERGRRENPGGVPRVHRGHHRFLGPGDPAGHPQAQGEDDSKAQSQTPSRTHGCPPLHFALVS